MAEGSLSSLDVEVLLEKGYRALRKIGEGSSSEVFLFEYDVPQDDGGPREIRLACKIIEVSKIPKDFSSKFLLREIDILSRVRHPNIIHLHGIFQRELKYFIFMRYAEVGNLCDFILSNGALGEPRARVWTRQVAAGLIYLHSLDIAHRDIKCENILITSNLNVKIADFGFSRRTLDGKGRPERSTTYCGSLAYTAPEILVGSPYEPKPADLWALGVVLYICLNKAMPFNSDNHTQLLLDQLKKNFRFRTKVRVRVSQEAVEAVATLLEPEVGKRATAEQFLSSKWVSADPRLAGTTAEEDEALKESLAAASEAAAALSKRKKHRPTAELAVVRRVTLIAPDASKRIIRTSEEATDLDREEDPEEDINDDLKPTGQGEPPAA